MNKGDIMLCSMRRNESWLFSFVRSLFQFLSMIFRVMYCMIFILILDDKLLQRHWFYDVSIEYYTVHRIHNSQYSDIFLALSVHRLADMKPPVRVRYFVCCRFFLFSKSAEKNLSRYFSKRRYFSDNYFEISLLDKLHWFIANSYIDSYINQRLIH